jgi:hypothetical protein
LGSTNLLNIALAFGFSIFVLVYAAASFSGVHEFLIVSYTQASSSAELRLRCDTLGQKLSKQQQHQHSSSSSNSSHHSCSVPCSAAPPRLLATVPPQRAMSGIIP